MEEHEQQREKDTEHKRETRERDRERECEQERERDRVRRKRERDEENRNMKRRALKSNCKESERGSWNLLRSRYTVVYVIFYIVHTCYDILVMMNVFN